MPVNNCLVYKMKTAFHKVDGEILLVFAVNGFIWIQPVSGADRVKIGGFKDEEKESEVIITRHRRRILRVVLASLHSRRGND